MTDFPPWTGPGAPDVDSLPRLNALEALDVMRAFLESYWEEGGRGEEEIRRLLSALNRDAAIWPDGGPADPAMWGDWLFALGKVKNVDLTDEATKPVRFAPPS